MKKLLILLSCIALSSPIYVTAESDPALSEIRQEIKDLESQILNKKNELNQLIQGMDGYYLIESNIASFIFSNPRIMDDKLLLDVDITNDTKGRIDLNSEIWSLSFSQEDDTSVTNLWVNTENLPNIEDRKQLSQNILLKRGASIQIVIALSAEQQMYYSEIPMEEEISEEITEEIVNTLHPEFKLDSPLHVRIESYSSPTGMTEEIIIDLSNMALE